MTRIRRSAHSLRMGVMVAALFAGCIVCNNVSGPEPSDTFVLTSPKPGSVFHVGDTLDIHWTIDSLVLSEGIVLRLSIDSGKTYFSILDGQQLPRTATAYSWHIPATILRLDPTTFEDVEQPLVSEACKISVSEYDTQRRTVLDGFFALR